MVSILKHRSARWLSLALALLIALAAFLVATPRPAAALGDPDGGTVVAARTGVLYPATSISVVTNTASPRTVGGVDLSLVRNYYAADYFITADFPTTGTLTATLEFSADATNWTTALHTYNNGATLVQTAKQVVITNDGTAYISSPVAGSYARIKLDPSTAVTASVNVVLKNTGGN